MKDKRICGAVRDLVVTPSKDLSLSQHEQLQKHLAVCTDCANVQRNYEALRTRMHFATAQEPVTDLAPQWDQIRSAIRVKNEQKISLMAINHLKYRFTFLLDKISTMIVNYNNNRYMDFMKNNTYKYKKNLQHLSVLLTCIILCAAICSFSFYAVWSRHDTKTGKTVAASVAIPTVNADPSQGCPKEELLQLAIGSSGDYPQLARCYGGRIQDSGIDSGSGPALIYTIHQQQSSISGQFHGLGMVGPFMGNLNLDGTLQFVVTPLGGSRSLLFQGHSFGGAGQIFITFNDLDQNGHILTDQYGSCTLIANATPSPTPTAPS
jgi:hypothetical protein